MSNPDDKLAVSRRLAADIVVEVAELPDRTSPDDWPEAMLVTEQELFDLLVERLARFEAQARLAGKREGMEEAAKIAKAHQPDRIKKGRKLSHYDPEYHEIIRVEENGEAIAAYLISATILKEATAIREQKP